MKQDRLAEAEGLHRAALDIRNKSLGHQHRSVAESLNSLAFVLVRQNRVAEAEELFCEEVDWARQRYGAASLETSTALAGLAGFTLHVTKKFAEAETFARECLAIAEKLKPNSWRTCHARSLVGAALVRQKRYAEAESLLLSAYEGTKQPGRTIPADQITPMLESLWRLYQATGDAGKAAEWKERLAAIDPSSVEAGLEDQTTP